MHERKGKRETERQRERENCMDSPTSKGAAERSARVQVQNLLRQRASLLQDRVPFFFVFAVGEEKVSSGVRFLPVGLCRRT